MTINELCSTLITLILDLNVLLERYKTADPAIKALFIQSDTI